MEQQGALFDRVNPEPAQQPAPVVVPTPSGMTYSQACDLPVAHSASPLVQHTSATGAQMAARGRARLEARYLAALRAHGALSDHEAAALLRVGLSSINSTRSKCMKQGRVVEAPSIRCQVVHWPDGGTTRRARWMPARPAEQGDNACGS